MSTYRYVVLDPTGNLTALVLDPVAAEDEALLTGELLKVSEQVAYLESPTMPDAEAAIRLMGGEFCGNASMAAAAWLLHGRLNVPDEAVLRLQVSGAEKPVSCRIRKLENHCRGTVLMPPVLSLQKAAFSGRSFTAVRMEGILHLIDEGIPMEKQEAEALLRSIVTALPDEAVGLMQWNRISGELRPLVFVRGSGSMVWEHGCGSGSAAVGAYEASLRGEGTTVTEIRQPGGVITVSAENRDGRIAAVSITGLILLGQEKTISPGL